MEQDREAAAAEQARAYLKLPLEGLLEAYKGFVAELPKGRYDVFLSHAARDATQVDALCAEMRALDLRVYIDRFDDRLPTREAVNRETANMLRMRMRACRMLVLAVTEHSASSYWIPWELGFFDGAAGEIFVLPLTDNVRKAGKGIEFLDLYRWLELGTAAAMLKTEAARLRNVIHREGLVAVTNDQVKDIVEVGPQALRHPELALQWQRQIWEATAKLQKAWFVAFQRAWGLEEPK
jgi:TIR domain